MVNLDLHKRDWIDIKERLPDKRQKVKILRSEYTSLGEVVIWSTTGMLTNIKISGTPIWSIKHSEGINKSNTAPTHWKPLDNKEEIERQLKEVREWLREEN